MFELKCRICPHCGYATPDIRKKIKNAEIVMKKRKYKIQPLRAAWVCEMEKNKSFKGMQKKIFYLYEKAKQNKQKVFEREIVEDGTIIDALRSTGIWKEYIRKRLWKRQ